MWNVKVSWKDRVSPFPWRVEFTGTLTSAWDFIQETLRNTEFSWDSWYFIIERAK